MRKTTPTLNRLGALDVESPGVRPVAKKTTKKKSPAPKKKTAGKAPASTAAASAKSSGKKKSPPKPASRPSAAAASKSAAAAAKPVNGKTRANGVPQSLAGLDDRDVEAMVREGELDAATLKKKKSGLTKKQLKYYRDLLIEKRTDILGDVASMQSNRGDGGNLSHMPVHMADVGSDNFEQEFTLGLMESERKLVADIDAALNRIEDGSYGICLITGHPIEEPRLEIKPWAKYCIAVVRARERMGMR